jgi:hypothetical protein
MWKGTILPKSENHMVIIWFLFMGKRAFTKLAQFSRTTTPTAWTEHNKLDRFLQKVFGCLKGLRNTSKSLSYGSRFFG